MAGPKFAMLREQMAAAQQAVSSAIIERALHQPSQFDPEVHRAILADLELTEEDVLGDNDVQIYHHRDVELVDNVETVIAGALPAILPRPSAMSVFDRCRDVAEFRARLAALGLSGFSRNVVLAGPAVRDLYMGPSVSQKHFRAYLVGFESRQSREYPSQEGFDSSEAALRAVAELFRTLATDDFVAGRGLCATTSYTLEIVPCRFASVSDVLRSQALGSHEFVWDGEDLGMSVMGRLAATYRVGVLDLETRRRGYEHALAADFALGYGLVLPQLDANALAAAGGIMSLLRVRITDVVLRAVLANTMEAIDVEYADRTPDSSAIGAESTVPEYIPEPKEKIEEAEWYGAALHA